MLVSVLMITYNHEKYIAQALESVLMQKVNFDYEIAIGEDCSTDTTRAIVEDFQQKYPEKIRLLPAERNLGVNRNFIRTLAACRGRYVAVLEGDDYWTSPEKLQKQFDFLENHPDFALCFHNVRVLDESHPQQSRIYCAPEQKLVSTTADLLKENFIPTLSVVFRNGLLDQIPDWFYSLNMGDWPLHLMNSRHGRIGYLDEVMGTYRMHAGGTWSSQNIIPRLQSVLIMYRYMNEYFGFEYADLIEQRETEFWKDMASTLNEVGVREALSEGSIGSVQNTFKHWPAALPLRSAWKTEVLDGIFGNLVFDSYTRQDRKTVRKWWLRLVANKPAWLANLGVWSIGLRSFFPPHRTGSRPLL